MLNSIKFIISVMVLLESVTGQAFGPTDAEIQAKQEFEQTLKPLLEQVRLKNKLEYGHRCDFDVEEQRQELGKTFLTSLHPRSQGQLNQEEINQRILQNFKSLTNLRGDFCSVFDNLLCNVTSHCDCVVADYDQGFNIKFIREANTCVLPKGAPCLPQNSPRIHNFSPFANSMEKTDSQIEPAKCSQSFPCKTKTTRKICTAENVELEIAAIAEDSQGTGDRREFFERHFQGGVCTCAGIQLEGHGGHVLLLIVAFVLRKL